MATIKESIEVDVPVSRAYTQWSHFEEFPRFMEQVEDIRVLDSRHFHWRAKYGGKEEEWDAEVTENVPDRLLAWRSTSGHRNDGIVEFEPISATSTRIHLKMDYEPVGVTEKVGSAIGMDERLVKKNLEDFKRYMETGVTVH